MKYIVWLGLCFALIGVGCDDPTPPPGPPGPPGPPATMDATPPMTDSAIDAGGDDATVDAMADSDGGTLDGGDADGSTAMDGSVAPDGGEFPDDAGTEPVLDAGFDADVEFDAGEIDAGPPGMIFCPMVAPVTCSMSLPCGSNEVCIPNGCGDDVCYPIGATCTPPTPPDTESVDCPSGSACTLASVYCQNPAGYPNCTDSRECPPGYSCDSGSCVDRRIACDFDRPCPWGYVCGGDDLSHLGAGFCVRAHTACGSDVSCPMRSIGGSFGAECIPLATSLTTCAFFPRDVTSPPPVAAGEQCNSLADCTVLGLVCGIEPQLLSSMCMRAGPCVSTADCSTGFECTDLWGDGISECVPTGGGCSSQADCAAGTLCAVPYDILDPSNLAAPSCISRPLPAP